MLRSGLGAAEIDTFAPGISVVDPVESVLVEILGVDELRVDSRPMTRDGLLAYLEPSCAGTCLIPSS